MSVAVVEVTLAVVEVTVVAVMVVSVAVVAVAVVAVAVVVVTVDRVTVVAVTLVEVMVVGVVVVVTGRQNSHTNRRLFTHSLLSKWALPAYCSLRLVVPCWIQVSPVMADENVGSPGYHSPSSSICSPPTKRRTSVSRLKMPSTHRGLPNGVGSKLAMNRDWGSLLMWARPARVPSNSNCSQKSLASVQFRLSTFGCQ